MDTQSYDKKIKELEDKLRALEVENKHRQWFSGKIFKFLTLGSATVIGAGVIFQQQTQLESQKEAITFLFDKLKYAYDEQTKNHLKLSAKIDAIDIKVDTKAAQFDMHGHQVRTSGHGWGSGFTGGPTQCQGDNCWLKMRQGIKIQ